MLYRLFSKLLDRGRLPCFCCKLVADIYSGQRCRSNGMRLSAPFGVRNGLRQGSVLSPSLFNAYIDSLYNS